MVVPVTIPKFAPAAYVVIDHANTPWFAMRTASWSTVNGASARHAASPGGAYGTVGTPAPSDTTASAMSGRSSVTPATENPVAVGGCACTTACTSGRERYTVR